MASSFMVAMSLPVSTFGAETPMKTSAPATASFSEPVTPPWLVCAAIQPRLDPASSLMSGRPPWTTPW